MKRASSVTSLAAKCLGITLAIVGGVTLAVSQNQPQKPSYTLAEFNAFRLVSAENNPQAKIKLVDDFTARFPHSVLIGFIYQNYSVTSFGLKNYPEAVIYADKLLALGDDELLSLGNSDLPLVRLGVLMLRAEAYSEGCDDGAFQTSEASANAKDAAAQGLLLLNQLEKPSPDMTDEGFSAFKVNLEKIFASAKGIAESRLNGDAAVCISLPPPPPQESRGVRFDRIIQDLLNEQKQTPVR